MQIIGISSNRSLLDIDVYEDTFCDEADEMGVFLTWLILIYVYLVNALPCRRHIHTYIHYITGIKISRFEALPSARGLHETADVFILSSTATVILVRRKVRKRVLLQICTFCNDITKFLTIYS